MLSILHTNMYKWWSDMSGQTQVINLQILTSKNIMTNLYAIWALHVHMIASYDDLSNWDVSNAQAKYCNPLYAGTYIIITCS